MRSFVEHIAVAIAVLKLENHHLYKDPLDQVECASRQINTSLIATFKNLQANILEYEREDPKRDLLTAMSALEANLFKVVTRMVQNIQHDDWAEVIAEAYLLDS